MASDMAGRPRTTLQKARELRDAADALHEAITDILPKQYVERGARGDALALRWLDTEDRVFCAFTSLDMLAGMLAEKVACAGNDAAARVTDLVESVSADETGEVGEAVEPEGTPSESDAAAKLPDLRFRVLGLVELLATCATFAARIQKPPSRGARGQGETVRTRPSLLRLSSGSRCRL